MCRPCRPENRGISVTQAFDLGYYVAPFQGLHYRLFFILNCKYPILPASIHYINVIIPSPYSPTLFHNPPIFSIPLYICFFLSLYNWKNSWWLWWLFVDMVDNAFWLRFIPGLCTEYTGLYPFYPLYVIDAFSLIVNGLMMVFVHKNWLMWTTRWRHRPMRL